MQVEVREVSEERAVFVVGGVDHSFVNALRRTLVADVPKMALDEVTVYDNTSALFDEVVAHRLGLIPIPTDLQAFVARDKCTCGGEGCANCTLLYTLSKEGPCLVVSGDLTPTDPKFRIKDPEIPIVKLLEGQRIMLEAAAILGTGTLHAKWCAVQGAGYREFPKVEVRPGPPLLPATLAEIARTAPEGSVSVEDGTLRVLDAEKAATYLHSVKDVFDVENVHVTSDPKRFVFQLETDGAITAKDAMKKALEILMEKLKGVDVELGKLKEEVPAT